MRTVPPQVDDDDGARLGAVMTLDDLVTELGRLRQSVGSPSFTELARRVAVQRDERGVPTRLPRPGRVTVYDAFRTGRARLDLELVIDLVEAMGGGEGADAWRRAHQRVFAARVSPAARPRLAGVPADRARLWGRSAEVEELVSLLAPALADPEADQPRLLLLSGIAGVGKSALALEVVGHLLEDAPGAVDLHVELRTGSASIGVETVPAAALAKEITRGLRQRRAPGEERVGAVVLLDDVARAGDLVAIVGELAPGTVVVATSRRRLDLAGAGIRHEVAPLPRAATAQLLREIAGAPGSVDSPESPDLPDSSDEIWQELAELCGDLPVVARVVAEQVRQDDGWTPADHVQRLRRIRPNAHAPLLEGAVDGLGPLESEVLEHIALHPARLRASELQLFLASPSGSPGTTAPEAVTAALAALLGEHLITQGANERFDVHDLIRSFALARAIDAVPASRVRAGVERLGLHLLAEAAPRLGALGYVRPIPGGPPVLVSSDAREVSEANAWLEDHLEVLVTTQELAAQHRLPELVSRTYEELYLFAQRTGRATDRHLLLLAATSHGVDPDSAWPLAVLAESHFLRGELAEARAALARAIAHADVAGLQVLHHVRGHLAAERGELVPAAEDLRRAWELCGEEITRLLPLHLGTLAVVLVELGEHEEARMVCERLMEVLGLEVWPIFSAAEWGHLAEAELELGLGAQAIEHATSAVAYAASIVDEPQQLASQALLARCLAGAGEVEAARALLEPLRRRIVDPEHVIAHTEWTRDQVRHSLAVDALAPGSPATLETVEAARRVVRRTGDTDLGHRAALALASTHLAQGRLEEAGSILEATLERLPAEHRARRAELLLAAGDVAAARGDVAQAREHWERALTAGASPRVAELLRTRVAGRA